MKYVFIRGFSRGIMPPPAVLPEAFTASESEQLADLGIPVASDRLTRYSEELFTVSRCVNLPSVRLYITYPLTGTDGRTLEPSPAVSELMEERNITAEGADSFGAEHYARTPETAGRYLAHIYRDRRRSGERRALLRRVSREFADMLYSVSGEKPDCDRHIISRSDASALFKFRSFSPTAINLLNNCKFGFFCRYGLGLNEYNDRDIEPALVGSVIHFCLQKLLGDYSGRRGEFLELSEEAINAHVASSIAEYEKKAYFDGFGGSQRFSYLLQRLGRYAVISAVRIRDELGMSGFYPEALEKWLSFPFGGITLSGVCDRIDTMTLDGKKYIRVIDYKHSSRDFSLDDIYRGENIQTLLYLLGICGMEKNAVPSSVLYLPVGKLTYERSDGSDITKKTRDSLQKYMSEHSPAGLILSDSPENAELDAINSELDRRYGVKKSGYISPVKVSGDEYRAIEAYCGSYLGSKVNEVMSGMVSACPSGSKACAYCGFSVFCGHRAAGAPADRS